MRHTNQKGTKVTHTEHSARKPSLWTGPFATLRASLCLPGSSAPTAARLCALAACLAAFFALTAAPAVAVPPNLCPPGPAAGQCANPHSVAVDQSTGTVYVAEFNNNRVSEFDSSGHFLRAFGFGVATGANELQTCTTVCIPGVASQENGTDTRPGAIYHPASLAVDPASHDVYVSEPSSSRVQKFSEAGQFLLMFGKGVDQGGGTPSHPGDVCTAEYVANGDTCAAGTEGPGPGAFERNAFVGDFTPLTVDPVTHDVWVADDERVQRFSAAGEHLSEVALPGSRFIVSLALDTSAGPSHGDFYTVNPPLSEQQRITPPASGTYELCFEAQCTAPLPFAATEAEVGAALQALSTIGPSNVGVRQRSGEFEVDFRGSLSLKDVPQIEASAGSVTTRFQGGPGALLQFDSSGTFLAALDGSGHPWALALDPATGDLFVGDCARVNEVIFRDCNNPYTLLQFDPSGAQLEAFGAGEVLGGPGGNALAFGDTAQRLYVVNQGLQAFPLPPPGPLLTVGATVATAVKKTTATLNAQVNPEGHATTYHFEYVDSESFEKEGGFASPHTVKTTESASIGADFIPHPASQAISPLTPATTYRFRLLATNHCNPAEPAEECTVDGETAEFTTLPPAAIDSTSVSDVTAESATLQAEINPLGDATSYRFEFLTEAAYLENEAQELPPFTGAAQVPLPAAPIGAGQADVAVSRHLQGLLSHTAYRYRVVVLNAVSEANGGPFGGPARTFTTQAPGTLGLPDNRAWELVSPPDKHGAQLTPISGSSVIQASAAGDAIAYKASAPTEAQPPGTPISTQVLSTRDPAGWASRDVGAPHEAPTGIGGGEYRLFSSDLSLGLLQLTGPFVPSLSPGASAPTPYLGTNFPPGNPITPCTASCYRPLVTGCPKVGECPPPIAEIADVPPGTAFGDPNCSPGFTCGPEFEGATPDFAHIVLRATTLTATPGDKGGLYEWSADAPPAAALRHVSVLTNGETIAAAYLGASSGNVGHNAISPDGSRVIFSDVETGNRHLYLRDLASEETVQLDAVQGGPPGGSQGSAPEFVLASADGSRVFFTDSQQLTVNAGDSGRDLYECAMVEEGGQLKCDLTDLTPLSADESANVQGVLGASEDGSYLYFVARGALVPAATPGDCHPEGAASGGAACNLYLRHDGTTKLLAVLAAADSADWRSDSRARTARVSPDGRRLVFSSQHPLTGYDNRDALSGVPDQEVYLYDAAANGGEGKLICASCNPTGARPHGKEFASVEIYVGGLVGSGGWPPSQWLAANVPGGTIDAYQSRYLSDSGRLFFNSSDALVPQDTNGTEDVYEYEPPGVGGCTESTPTFAAASEGCVSLISSGTSAEESAFLDASESGNDVFFLTTSKLSLQDFDTSLDLYDAHVCTAQSPCPPPPPPPTPPCEGDACQLPAVPPNDPTPGSLTFQGAGNVIECPKGKLLKGGKCVAKKHKAKKHKKHAKAHRKHKRAAGHNRGGGK